MPEKEKLKLTLPKADFKFPESKKGDAFEDKPLNIIFVDGLSIYGLVANLASLVIVYSLFRIAISIIQRFDLPTAVTVGIPLVAVVAFLVMFYDKMWVNPDDQTAVKYLDSLAHQITVYFQGFHFVPWYSKPMDDTTSFQKHAEIKSSKTDGTLITFQTLDGYDVATELVCFFNRRNERDALRKSLKYQMSGLNTRTRAIIASRLAALGGLNTYEALLQNKDEVTAWVALIFGGEDTTSPHEEETGLRVFNPVMESFDLTAESKKVFAKKAQVDVFVESLDRLTGGKPVLPASEASDAIQVATGSATRTIVTNNSTHKYEGVPPNVSVFAPGSDGVAVGSKGGK